MSALAGPASEYDMSVEKCSGAGATNVAPQDWTSMEHPLLPMRCDVQIHLSVFSPRYDHLRSSVYRRGIVRSGILAKVQANGSRKIASRANEQAPASSACSTASRK